MTDKKLKVGNAWVEYTDNIYDNVDVSPTQIKETRLAFYAGAWTVLNIMIEIADQPEMAAIMSVEDLRVEIEEFVKRELGREPTYGSRSAENQG